MDKVNKPVLIAGNKPVNSKWPQSNNTDDIDSVLKIDPTKITKQESINEPDFTYDQNEIQEYNKNEEARLSDISKTVFKTSGVKEKIVNVPSPLEPTTGIPAGKIANATVPNTQTTSIAQTNNSVVPPSTTGSVIPAAPITTNTVGAPAPTSSTNSTASSSPSFNPVFVSDIDAIMNAARDSFDWAKHGLPEFGLGMTDEQKQYLYYKTDYLEVSAKDREKPVDLRSIASQLDNPNSKLSKYVVNSHKAISQAGGVIKGDSSLGNLAKAFRALANSGKNIYDIAAQTNDGDMIEVSDLTFSVKDINFSGIDESKQSEANELRKKFYDFISPFLQRGHQLGQVIGYLDQEIADAIKDGPKTGSLNGQTITYYPQKGGFSSMLAIYSDGTKRPKDFFKEVDKYFDSMMELAGKPKETPINS